MFDRDGPTLAELARQAMSSTERGYDLLAPKFDHTPFRTPDHVLDAVGAHLARRPQGRGLDLGCGTGAGMEVLRSTCQGGVVGLDISRGMLEVCRRNLAASGDEGTAYVRGDMLRLPFRREFDVVLCLGALGHILARDQRRLIAEVAAVLRPGGRFCFVSAFPPPPSSPRFWAAHAFNGAMRVRNALHRPPFVMYYVTFLLPGVRSQLEDEGLTVEVEPLGETSPHLRLVVATSPLTGGRVSPLPGG